MLAVVTCHWNPAGWANLRRNYLRFLHEMAWWGLPTFSAEVAFAGQAFPTSDAFLQIEAGDQHRLWQKERLINRVVELLPDCYDQVAWIDADVLFLDHCWPDRVSDMLQEHPVVQLWDSWHCTDHAGRVTEVLRSVGDRGERYTSKEQSSPGGAWAARRDVFPLYDRMIVGSGDAMMLEAWIGQRKSTCMERSTPAMAADYAAWSAEAYEKVAGDIAVLPGHTVHLYHGSRRRRQYRDRWEPVIAAGYDPRRHVTIDDTGLLAWTDEAPQQLRSWVAGYFGSRQEDEQATADGPADTTPAPAATELLPVRGGPWHGQRYPRSSHRYACMMPTVPAGYHWYELLADRWVYVGATDKAEEPPQ